MPPAGKSSHFQPRIHWSARLIAWVLIVLYVLVIFLVAQSSAAWWLILTLVGVVCLLVITIVDKAYFTSYALDSEGVTIQSQLRKLQIPSGQILKVEKQGVRALISTRKRKRFAFALPALAILVEGMPWEEITVSPEQPDLFTEQLLATMKHERSQAGRERRS
jgi:hypothetical protein